MAKVPGETRPDAAELGNHINGPHMCTVCTLDGQHPHQCPFKVEIRGNDELCTCCVECERECAQDI